MSRQPHTDGVNVGDTTFLQVFQVGSSGGTDNLSLGPHLVDLWSPCVKCRRFNQKLWEVTTSSSRQTTSRDARKSEPSEHHTWRWDTDRRSCSQGPSHPVTPVGVGGGSE